MVSGNILDGDIPGDSAVLANVCCPQRPLLACDADLMREAPRRLLPAKILRFLSRFGILRSRVKSESRRAQGGYNDFVRPPFFTINAR